MGRTKDGSARTSSRSRRPPRAIPKAPSGIHGLDEITGGGLPRGRPTLVCGGPGCGKTLFALEFLARGAVEHGDPGVFMSFEESEEELAANAASLGFDVAKLVAQKRILVDHVRVERAEIEETGEFNLEGLFVRLQHAIAIVGARRVVLDTVESLFAGLPSPDVLRSELRRLFRWLKERGQTVVITGEKGEGSLTRHGLEEYVSDCVILLDHRVNDQVSTRRLRVVKYRGSTHGTNEYPFLIDEGGISVLPVTSLSLQSPASTERVSTGLPRLDEMLGGGGVFRGTTNLVSGTAGSGKTSAVATMARDFCRKGGRCLYFAFEESAAQVTRNLRSIGLELEPLRRTGRLRFEAARPTTLGLEMHLVAMHRAVEEFQPGLVVVDPILNLANAGTPLDARSLLVRLMDYLKAQGVTVVFTSLTRGAEPLEETELGVSSLVDTWLLLEVVRTGGERNRMLSIIKSRGMAHSNQAAEYRLTDAGIEILDTYVGPGGFVSGSARVSQEAADRAAALALDGEIARLEALRSARRRAFEGKQVALEEEASVGDAELERSIEDARAQRERVSHGREEMAVSRSALGQARPGVRRNGVRARRG